MVLSSGSGPGLDLSLVLGLPLQLKLAVSSVVLSQGLKKEILALPSVGLGSLLNLWVHPQGVSSWGLCQVRVTDIEVLSTLLEIAKGRGEDK